MKNQGKVLYAIFMGTMLMTIPLQEVMATTNSTNNMNIETLAKDKFAGGWDYTVTGAPQGYEEGFLLIVADGDSYKVQIQTGGGTMAGENVRTKGSTIMFDVMVEGGKVGVSLTVKGSTISGTSTTPEGTMAISGTKTLSPE